MRIGILAFVGLMVFAFLARPLWENKVVVDGDLGRAHLPSRYFYQQCLQSGDNYTWCPGQFCGYFIHGEGQGGYDHPVHRALYTFVPLVPAFNLEVFLNYPFMLAGTFLFLRRHGLSREIALFGGLSFAFSGFNLPHYPHTNAVAIVAHIPWLLWATDILWKSDSRCQRAWAQFGITILTASQILLGYPQYLWFSAVAEGLYALTLLTTDWRWDRLAFFIIAKLLGIAAGAAQLLPTLEALLDSPRMVKSVEFCGSFSLHPANLLQLVVPGAFHERVQMHEYTVYAGVMASLAIAWLFIRPPTPKKELGRWTWLMILIAVPLACGKYTCLFHSYTQIPVLGVFRCPCRYMVLAHLAAAAFVTMTAAQLDQKRTNQLPWSRLAWLAIVPLAATALAFAGMRLLGSEMEPFVTGDRTVWIGVSVFALAALLFAQAARGSRFALTLLMALSLADQAAFAFRSINLYRTADLASYGANEVQPPGPVHGRVVLGDVHGNALNLLDMKLTNAYVGLTPMRKLNYSTDAALKLAGTEWRHDGKEWHRIDSWLPRVRLVTQAQVCDDPRRDLEHIDAGNVVLLEKALNLPAGLPGEARVVLDQPGAIEIDTNAESQQVLVVAESFQRGWYATIDGIPAELLRAYGDFQSVVVPAGEHHVTLRFAPESVRWGRRISMIGLLLAAAFSLGTCRWCRLSYATQCEN